MIRFITTAPSWLAVATEDKQVRARSPESDRERLGIRSPNLVFLLD